MTLSLKYAVFGLLLFAGLLVLGCASGQPPGANTTLPNQTGNQNASSNGSGSLASRAITMAEVAQHNQMGDCWCVINGNVLDLSDFTGHPGGSAYLPYCGKDGTQGYDTKAGKGSPHSSTANQMMANYIIGTLKQ